MPTGMNAGNPIPEALYPPEGSTPVHRISELGKRLEKNAAERRGLVEQTQMALEEASKACEMASHLVKQHGEAIGGPEGL